MSEIKEKVEAELKAVKSMCETMENAIKTQIDKGLDKVNTHEMYEAVDIYKDLTEVKKNIVETCYKMQIMEAMEESEYGEDYDEDGPIEQRFYNAYRYANGRYAPKGRGSRRGFRMTPEMYRKYPAEYYRDMDREDGMMYYTSSGSGSGSMSTGNSRNYSDGYSDGSRMGYDDGYSKGYSEGQMSSRRDMREGRSGQRRKSYLETKEAHRDNTPESKQANMKELELYMNELSGDITDMIKDASQEERNMLKNKMQVLVQKLG